MNQCSISQTNFNILQDLVCVKSKVFTYCTKICDCRNDQAEVIQTTLDSVQYWIAFKHKAILGR